jgi:hypothetical protein
VFLASYAAPVVAPGRQAVQERQMRRVIVHYHIFKNSGTSFEKLLDDNYGDDHLVFDGPFRFSKIDQDELRKVIQHTGHLAYSSHQVNLPVPTALDFVVEPVVFLRHPLLRIRSVHGFSRKSPEAVHDGQSAVELDFVDWVRSSLRSAQGMAALSNAQTRNLGGVYGRTALQRRLQGGGFEFDLSQALRNLDNVRLLGRTEFFDTDVPRFEGLLAECGIPFRYARHEPSNRTASDFDQGLEQRLQGLRDELGDELYGQLEHCNQQDLQLFDYANQRLGSGPA